MALRYVVSQKLLVVQGEICKLLYWYKKYYYHTESSVLPSTANAPYATALLRARALALSSYYGNPITHYFLPNIEHTLLSLLQLFYNSIYILITCFYWNSWISSKNRFLVLKSFKTSPNET